MQTCRHWIFAALALCLVACAAKPRVSEVVAAAPATAAEPVCPEPPPPSAQAAAPLATGEGEATLAMVRIPAADTVLLHFREPVSVPTSFQPSRFRLSVAELDLSEDPDDTSMYYYDVSEAGDDETLLRVIAASSDDALTVRLRLEPPLDEDMCEGIQEAAQDSAEDSEFEGGLYLHYRGGPAGLATADGRWVPSIAPHWVERRARVVAFEGANVSGLEAWGPISCEFVAQDVVP